MQELGPNHVNPVFLDVLTFIMKIRTIALKWGLQSTTLYVRNKLVSNFKIRRTMHVFLITFPHNSYYCMRK